MPEIPDLLGDVISVESLSSSKAQGLARYLLSERCEGIELVECRRLQNQEALIVVARPHVSQRPTHDIRYEEPLAISFALTSASLPDVVALRKDFPQVPHLNLRLEEYPKSLCLFAESPEELSLRWTPAFLVERILWWLKETAQGTLHKSDQALEPFFGGVLRPLILPPDIFSRSDKEVLTVYRTNLKPDREILVADRRGFSVQGSPFTLFAFQFPPQQHGVIRREPQSLSQLHDICLESGFDLLAHLATHLKNNTGRITSDFAGTIIVLGIPKVRASGESIESTDIFGFRCQANLEGTMSDVGPANLGVILGLIASQPSAIVGQQNAGYYPLLSSPESVHESAKAIKVSLLLPQLGLLPKTASLLSGLETRSTEKIFAIGQGALGSQVFENLARQGWGQWTLVDHDYFAPHNAVRHAIWGRRFGLSKAKEMASRANELFYGEPLAEAIVANVMRPEEDAEALTSKAEDANLILDMSASVPVSRHLARDFSAPAKRASAFLNPTGTDLVVMAEDRGRTILLDSLESQYLRALLHTPDLSSHLQSNNPQTRYGRGCNDLTSHLSQETIALHASIASKAVRDIVRSTEASLTIWQCKRERMEVTRTDVPVYETISHTDKGWTIVWDAFCRSKLFEYRQAQLPRETCGVLIGYLDTSRQIIYICDLLPAPPDSTEEAAGCQRGIEGMDEILRLLAQKTLGQVTYIGEWHTHPDGYPCRESEQDKRQMAWVKEKLHPEGRPALIAIGCQDEGLRYYLEVP